MLSKLWKHEIVGTGRMMAVFYVILAAATALLSVIGILKQRFENISGIFTLSMVFYAVTIIAALVVSFAYLCVRFYQTMYSAQGYLTHTLPVKTTSILNVKIITSCGYLFLTLALCLLSVFTVCMVQTSGEAFGILKAAVQQTVAEFAGEAQMPKAAAAISLIVAMALTVLNALLLFFAGSSIGQLFSRSKAAYGIAASIGLYYVGQVISLVLVGIGYLAARDMVLQYGMKWAVVFAIVMAVCWTVAYYTISRVVVTRHLNLE